MSAELFLTAMPVTALDLPAELIRRVADDIVNSSVVGLVAVGETHNLWPVREVLSQCSLTCRYWCRIFRSFIFFEISLHSYEEVVELTSLADSSKSEVGTFVEVLRIDQRDQTTPWLHHIPALTDKLPNCKRVTLRIDDPLFGTSVRALTTLHPLLPSTIPAHYSNFTSLTLSTHRFNDFSELVRLTRGIPRLTDLTCSTVTWETHTPVRETQQGLRFASNLRDVSTVACQEDAPMLWLLTTNRKAYASPYSPVVSVPEMAKVIEVVETLLKCGRTRDQPQAFLKFATSMHTVPPSKSQEPERKDDNSHCGLIVCNDPR